MLHRMDVALLGRALYVVGVVIVLVTASVIPHISKSLGLKPVWGLVAGWATASLLIGVAGFIERVVLQGETLAAGLAGTFVAAVGIAAILAVWRFAVWLGYRLPDGRFGFQLDVPIPMARGSPDSQHAPKSRYRPKQFTE